MLIHVIGIYGRDLDSLLLRFKDESCTGSVFQIVSFSGTVVATSPAKFFSAFYILLQKPSCLIVFFSENWRRHAFFKISVSVSFCHRKRHHQDLYQIVSNVESCDSQCAGL